eukprot:7464041-Pyramimonas_sp.AAC.1
MGPAWAQCPQTAQAGEYLARGVAAVVKHFTPPTVDGLSGGRMCSGVILEASAGEGNRFSAVVKVRPR